MNEKEGMALRGCAVVTPPSLPLEVSVRLEAGPGAGRGSHPVLPPSGAVRGLHGQQEPHQHWNIQEALQAGSCGLRQTLPLQTAAPFEAVAASSSLLLPFSDSHRVPWDQSQTSSSQNKPRLPKSERGAVIPQGCSAAPRLLNICLLAPSDGLAMATAPAVQQPDVGKEQPWLRVSGIQG